MRRAIFLWIPIALLLLGAVALALGTSYGLSWWTVDGGGGTSRGEGFAVSGTAGQPDAGLSMNGAGYALSGGFWLGGEAKHQVFLPLVLRPAP
ncbi:MAG: hypothetical protein ISS56_06920 [Anaerolineae bacterium]|nr:hypothetical protein [Anaerolineae bacterium]